MPLKPKGRQPSSIIRPYHPGAARAVCRADGTRVSSGIADPWRARTGEGRRTLARLLAVLVVVLELKSRPVEGERVERGSRCAA
jgi:hypothetical protein